MKQTLNGFWDYRIGKGEWKKRQVPYSALCVGHSECRRYFGCQGTQGRVLLVFEGITYNATVYLNGVCLGKLLPYCEYSLDVTDTVKPEGNCLLVEIEDVNAHFGPSEGWENYGGIIRDVYLLYKNEAHITDVYFCGTPVNEYRDGEYRVDVSKSRHVPCRITLSLGERVVDTYVCDEAETRTVKGASLWSPDSPTLYTLTVELLENGQVVDTRTRRVGFCEFKCGESRFTLNGKDIFLKGVCRHEMYGKDSGHTVPYDLIYKDMKMIKDAGCNFVRLVHYPHNKQTLDIADELGLLCCEEPGMWQADVFNPLLTNECLEVLERTVKRDRSHPSIAFWLAFNECDFNEEFLKKAVEVCRKNDPFRPVSGANNMSNEETLKYYNLCQLDFYTMHPYSETFEMARRAACELKGKPLMFTEWGGYYVYDNPHLLSDFLMSMYDLYRENALAGTCIWYWAEINDYNRGGAACTDGVLKEALVDFDREPNLIYGAFVECLCKMNEDGANLDGYEATVHLTLDKKALKSLTQPDASLVLSAAREPMKTRLAKTRKKVVTHGPILAREEIPGMSTVPYLVTDEGLEFECGAVTNELYFLGMTSLNYGYPILGEYGEDVAEIAILYEDGDSEKYVAKNGIDVTLAYTSVGSSRINPVAQNAKRIISFSYDKNFEEYAVNVLPIKVKEKKISSVKIRSLNKEYRLLIYGLLA